MTSSFPAFFVVFFTFLALVAPAPLRQRDVFVPPVLYPHSGTVWTVGSCHNVTWDTSNPPKQITNKLGRIILAKAGRLDIDNPLAEGFNILDGHHEITVPNVNPDSDYAIIVFGDSGNSGEQFTIKQ